MLELIINWIIELISYLGYFGVFVLMALESANIPIPSEVIMPFAGYLAYLGKFSLIGITIAGALGNLFGSIISYYIGFYGGRKFVKKYGKYFLMDKRHIDIAEKWFKKYGDPVIFFSRLLPIIRTFISFPAGLGKMDIKKFIIYTFIGALIWCSIIGYAGFFLGPQWETLLEIARTFEILIIAIIILILIYFWKFRK